MTKEIFSLKIISGKYKNKEHDVYCSNQFSFVAFGANIMNLINKCN